MNIILLLENIQYFKKITADKIKKFFFTTDYYILNQKIIINREIINILLDIIRYIDII